MPNPLYYLSISEDQIINPIKTSVLRASPSTSTAIMTKGFPLAMAVPRADTMDWILEIFFSLSRTEEYVIIHISDPWGYHYSMD